MAVVCAYVSFGQAEQKNTPGTQSLPNCPPGWCSYWEYIFDVFNFHKPRTGCKTGFGLCIMGHTNTGCRPCYNNKSNAAGLTKIESGKATCFGELKNNKLELHIPAQIKNETGFASEDFSTFTIEKGTLKISVDGKEKVSREGVYPVIQVGDEYVVVIDLE